MSEIQWVVRDAMQDWSGRGSIENAWTALAALSADPVTIQELDTAMERFAQRRAAKPFDFLPGVRPGIDDEPAGSGLIVLDLAARLVVTSSPYLALSPSGSTPYRGDDFPGVELGYDLAEEWQFETDIENWRWLAEQRRLRRAGQDCRDTRGVLYGHPLLEFIARQTFLLFPQRAAIAQAFRAQWSACSPARSSRLPGTLGSSGWNSAGVDAAQEREDLPMVRTREERETSPFYDALKDVHARWLMTPHAALEGQTPRAVLLATHHHRMADMQHRCNQWSLTGVCPRGVEESSHAFRFGGFGTHELVKYYELVRELLWSTWNQLLELDQSPHRARRPASWTVDEFVAAEVTRLERVRDQWLDTPDPECHDRTPREMIDQERARIPEVVSGHDAMIDPDCPCCQMLAELPGPIFWYLDPSGLDPEFAFDLYHTTREDWDAEQAEWDASGAHPPGMISGVSITCLGEGTGKPPAGAPSEGRPQGVFSDRGVWSRSGSIADPQAPVEFRLFGLAAHLAELGLDLRERGISGPGSDGDSLQRHFGNLREIFFGGQAHAASLLDPLVRRFTEDLEELAERHPDLEPKCTDLARQLEHLRRAAETEE